MSTCTTEYSYKSFFDGEPCESKKVEGVLAKQRIALQLIIQDIYECNDALNFIIENNDSNLCSIVYKSFIITYGKCFTVGATRGVSLNAKDIFKDQNSLFNVHQILLKTRNKYVAHSDSDIFESSEVYFVKSSSEHEFFVPTLRFNYPTGESLKKEHGLVLYLYEQVKKKILKLENRLVEKHA